MPEVQTFLREAWAAAEREKAIEDAVVAAQARALAADVAAAKAQQGRRDAASKKRAETGAEIGTAIGGIVMGFSGCVSCINHIPPVGTFPPVPLFNLVTGWFLGMICGAAIGAAFGYMSGQTED